jgi:hypothetical protein
VAVDAPAIDEWRNAFGPYRVLEQNRELPVIHGRPNIEVSAARGKRTSPPQGIDLE